MPEKLPITPGRRFGRWNVVKEAGHIRTKSGISLRQVLCKCTCGTQRVVRWVHITSGRSLSCGCLKTAALKSRIRPVAKHERFGRWTVISEASSLSSLAGYRVRRLLCRCDCGTQRVVKLQSLVTHNSLSCGCFQRERTREAVTRHGHCRKGTGKSRAYASWQHMRFRCENPQSAGYRHYGGRGIRVCKRWQSFENFLADMGEPSPRMSLDRLNNNGDYKPSNCKWSSYSDQLSNTRVTVYLRFRGESLSLRDWSQRTGIPRRVLYHRRSNLLWSVRKTLTAPYIARKPYNVDRGLPSLPESHNFGEWVVAALLMVVTNKIGPNRSGHR
jgi:hypothetical protein